MRARGTSFCHRTSLFVDFISMAAKESSSMPPVVILTLNEYKEYLHLTQAAKFAFTSSVA